MNSLEIKKRAFMSVVTRRYGFIRTKSGASPLTLTNCLSGNLVDYKIFGNVGKNLIPYPYAETTKTVSGITVTDNGDGSITVNGTATANAIFQLNKASTSIHVDKGERYRLSGAPTGGGTSAYLLLAYDTVNGYNDAGNGVVFAPKSENLTVSIRAYTGTTFDNLVFKPMLTKGGDATEYEPYKRVGDLDGDKYKIPITVSGKNLLENFKNYTISANYNNSIIFEAGKSYTFSFSESTSSNWRLMIFGTNIDGTPITKPDNVAESRNEYLSGMYTGATGRLYDAGNRTDKTATYLCNKSFICNRITYFNTDNVNDTFTNPQFELGETATEYEPYKEPHTTNIFLNAPLGIGESIDYKTDSLPDIFVSEGTNIISAETEVKPSAIEVKYRSSIEEG